MHAFAQLCNLSPAISLQLHLCNLRYTIAGGASCILKEGKTAPENPLLKIQFDGVNPYSNKARRRVAALFAS